MTVKLLAQWGDQPPGTLYTAATAGTETAMIAAGQATATLTGGVVWVPPGSSPDRTTEVYFDPVTQSLVSGDGTELLPIGAGLVDTTVTASGTLPITALGRITPVNAAGSTTQTLPSAATAWALKPYGVVVLVQRGAGVPSFAAGGGDTLRATSGIGACVQYGMIAAQVQSATEWALA